MRPLRIGIVAGEASGDLLGSGLIASIKAIHPDAVFEGIGGPRMIAEGFHSQFPMERLSVMGLVEVLGRLFELLGIRRRLKKYFIDNPPDVFIGIDAPDFTLSLERQLRAAGIKTVHYVSPQIWAWRQGRVKHITQCADLMLTLFPFEKEFYKEHGMPVQFVGHPLADQISFENDKNAARIGIGIEAQDCVLALLPGSRLGEVGRLTATFLSTALWCQRQRPECKILIAAANDRIAEHIRSELRQFSRLKNVQIVTARAREVMAAADALLVASGTVTLEAALIKRPMVVAYKVAPLTYQIASRLVKTDSIALPNLLAGKVLVPEFIQDKATSELIGPVLLDYLNGHAESEAQIEAFMTIHQQLALGASDCAARAIINLVNR